MASQGKGVTLLEFAVWGGGDRRGGDPDARPGRSPAGAELLPGAQDAHLPRQPRMLFVAKQELALANPARAKSYVPQMSELEPSFQARGLPFPPRCPDHGTYTINAITGYL